MRERRFFTVGSPQAMYVFMCSQLVKKQLLRGIKAEDAVVVNNDESKAL